MFESKFECIFLVIVISMILIISYLDHKADLSYKIQLIKVSKEKIMESKND